MFRHGRHESVLVVDPGGRPLHLQLGDRADAVGAARMVRRDGEGPAVLGEERPPPATSVVVPDGDAHRS
jgi:hypothetical protein